MSKPRAAESHQMGIRLAPGVRERIDAQVGVARAGPMPIRVSRAAWIAGAIEAALLVAEDAQRRLGCKGKVA